MTEARCPCNRLLAVSASEWSAHKTHPFRSLTLAATKFEYVQGFTPGSGFAAQTFELSWAELPPFNALVPPHTVVLQIDPAIPARSLPIVSSRHDSPRSTYPRFAAPRPVDFSRSHPAGNRVCG